MGRIEEQDGEGPDTPTVGTPKGAPDARLIGAFEPDWAEFQRRVRDGGRMGEMRPTTLGRIRNNMRLRLTVHENGKFSIMLDTRKPRGRWRNRTANGSWTLTGQGALLLEADQIDGQDVPMLDGALLRIWDGVILLTLDRETFILKSI
mgnify:CR=1 FL=1